MCQKSLPGNNKLPLFWLAVDPLRFFSEYTYFFQRDVSHSSSSSSGREGRRVDLGPPSGKEGGRGELGPSSGRESERNTGGRGYPEDLYSTRINAEGEDGWGAPNEAVARREGGRGSTPGRLTAPPACFSPLRFCAYFSLFSFVLIIFDNLSGKSLSLLRALLISTYVITKQEITYHSLF